MIIKKIIAKFLMLAAVMPAILFSALVDAAPITVEFKPQENLVNGNIVSVDTTDRTVFKTSSKNIHMMYGVVTDVGNIAFHGDETEDQVPVANTGILPVLVSDSSGDIKSGDPITVSTLAGIGEKALRAGRIIGIAVTDFSKETESASPRKIEQNGQEKEVHIGFINVKVGASDYTPSTSPINHEDGQNRNMLERISDHVTGKITKPLGIIIAGLILLCGAFVATFLITSSSYSSMISIGRNPLAEKKVLRSLLGLIVLSIGIFCVSTLLAYGALKLLG